MNPSRKSTIRTFGIICMLLLLKDITIAAPINRLQLTYEAKLSELVLLMSNQPGDASLNKALATTDSQRANSSLPYFDLFEKTYKAQNKNGNLALLFVKKNQYDVKINSTNKVVIGYLKKESVQALKQTKDIQERRLAAEGMTTAEIIVDADKGTLKIAIDDNSDAERMRKYLGTRGEFGIYEVYNNEEIIQSLFQINDSLAQVPEVRRRKLNVPANTSEEMSLFIRENPLFAVLYPMMGDSGKVMTGPVSGRLMQSEQKTLNYYFSLPTALRLFPANGRIFYEHALTAEDTVLFIYAAKLPVTGVATINSEHIVSVVKDQSVTDPNEYTVVIKMDAKGTADWDAMTLRNVGHFLVFTVDKEVYSAPKVVGRINAGMTEIASHFSKQQAEDIANILKYGPLPLTLNLTTGK